MGTWNDRLKHDGWRTAAEQMRCPACGEDRLVWLSTIHGRTSADCAVCCHSWTVDPPPASMHVNGTNL